jgi:hypothetical protein
VSEAIEDHAPMAANVVAKTAAMVPLLHYFAAIELLTAAQAVDLRKLEHSALGRGAAVAYDAVRRARCHARRGPPARPGRGSDRGPGPRTTGCPCAICLVIRP